MKIHSFNKKFHNDDGAAIVETAFVLPILIMLVALIFEMGMYILLHSKLTRMAGVITDAITRQNLTQSALIGLMNTADNITNPFNFSLNGKMVVSQVHNKKQSTKASDMVIGWQQSKNSGVSLIGSVGTSPQNLPGDITVIQDQSIVVTEVFYQYSPLIFKNYLPIKSIYKTAVFVPRSGDMNDLLAG
ncbi:MAG: pilus assembly protein [Candidatus Paracaedibacteraceae bacterium]|nr:pilus assembly protein [Candidatus Paracaedibacteraceae bacterium]